LLPIIALFALNAGASEYVPGEVIVKYKSGVVRTRTTMNSLYNSINIKKVNRLNPFSISMERLVANEGTTTEQLIAKLSKNPMVEYAQPNYILRLPKQIQEEPAPGMPSIPCIPGFELPGCTPIGDGGGSVPCLIPGFPFPPGCSDSGEGGGEEPPPASKPELQDPPADVYPPVADPDIEKAYGLGKTGAVDAWKEYASSKEIIVAVIDTGHDYNHEDLAANIWRGKDESGATITGWDFIHGDGMPFDDQGHGTHTSGTVGAVYGNGKGVSGVAPKISLMGVKFLSAEGSGTTADAIKSIDFAVAHGAKVLSNSWGGQGGGENKALKDSIEAAGAKGVLFVVAAGNDGADNDGSRASYPAAFNSENILSVAATDKMDKMTSWSNYGKVSTDLAAPGSGVYSTMPGSQYKAMSGTSMACPHVAGAAAYLWSQHPEWDYKKVKQVLMETADKVPGLETKTVTGARLNILKALQYKE
jgi:subtilisin family serine protease